MRKFTFAGLTARKPKAAEDAEDMEKKPDAETAEGEEDEAAPETPPEDEAEGDDAKDEAGDKAAFRRGERAGRQAERVRCAAIFEAATPGTAAQAAHLAFNTDVSAKDAKAILAAAPKAAGGLAEAMRGRNPASLASAPAGGASSDLPPELAAAQARRLAAKKER